LLAEQRVVDVRRCDNVCRGVPARLASDVVELCEVYPARREWPPVGADEPQTKAREHSGAAVVARRAPEADDELSRTGAARCRDQISDPEGGCPAGVPLGRREQMETTGLGRFEIGDRPSDQHLSLRRTEERVAGLDPEPVAAERSGERLDEPGAAVRQWHQVEVVLGRHPAPAGGDRRRRLAGGEGPSERVGSDEHAHDAILTANCGPARRSSVRRKRRLCCRDTVRDVSTDAVLLTRRLPEIVMDRLERECDLSVWAEDAAMPRDGLLVQAAGKRALVTLLTERVDDELLDAAGEQLLIVANYAVGFDNVDVAACSRRSVMVSNTPDVLTETTADMAFALMMAAARRVAEGDRFLRERRPWIWGPEMMLGQDVHGKTLGIVGFGRIGRAVARRGAGFGMTVLYHDPLVPPGSADLARSMPLEEMLTISDFVSVHVNLSPATRHLIDAARLQKMKSTAVLVNTARGQVVDEHALAEALQAGVIAAAGLDVYENEPDVDPLLLEQTRAVLVPHLASATVETRVAMGMLAVDNVLAALGGERPPTLLNEEVWRRRVDERSGRTG
jgi:glyoxylate reductase